MSRDTDENVHDPFSRELLAFFFNFSVTIASVASSKPAIEALEIHHLSNRDPHLHFALLTDFRDAQESDVYQDLFGEGSFTGKGIYDVDTFQRAMAGRFPENKVLSHDLLEACHARSAELRNEQPISQQQPFGRSHEPVG